jgi:hypothetical protein
MLRWVLIPIAAIVLGCQFDPNPILKIVYAGSYLVVPEGKTWNIDRAFISEGGMYNILIQKSTFRDAYHSGDTIRIPYYIAEMELLNNQSMVQFQLHIKEE